MFRSLFVPWAPFRTQLVLLFLHLLHRPDISIRQAMNSSFQYPQYIHNIMLIYVNAYGYIYIHIPHIYIYIWVNYNDLTATSLESWLIRGIIPKWPQFRLVKYYNLPRYIYIYTYICISITNHYLSCSSVQDVHNQTASCTPAIQDGTPWFQVASLLIWPSLYPHYVYPLVI